jgi:glycerol-3-phosphate acyltransferase PlsY
LEPAVNYLLIALLAYLIGAFPTAYVIVKVLTGRDIRRLGTGNVGVMNTIRQVGLPAGMLAFLGEGAKGIGAVGAARVFAGTAQADSIAAIMALVGVNWSVFMRFAGGRGTTISVFIALALMWPLVVVMGMLWLVVYRLYHDNFLATRVNILAAPFVTAALLWATSDGWAYVGAGDGRWVYVPLVMLGSLVALLRHKRETDDHFIAATAPARTE